MQQVDLPESKTRGQLATFAASGSERLPCQHKNCKDFVQILKGGSDFQVQQRSILQAWTAPNKGREPAYRLPLSWEEGRRQEGALLSTSCNQSGILLAIEWLISPRTFLKVGRGRVSRRAVASSEIKPFRVIARVRQNIPMGFASKFWTWSSCNSRSPPSRS